MKIKDKIRNYLREPYGIPFEIKPVGEYGKWDIENDCKIILYRSSIKHHAPSAAGLMTIGTGIAIDIKPGYCGILEPRQDIGKSGLSMCNSPKIIMPGNTQEVTLDFYLNQKLHFSEKKDYYEPYTLGQIIGYITIVKTM